MKPAPKGKIPPLTEARLRAAARQAINAASKSLVEFANQEAATFQKAISQQKFASFRSRPLADATLAKKAQYGRSWKTMIATGTYVAGIRAFPRSTRNGGITIFVGHAPRLLARDTVTGKPRQGVTMRKVAYWQEHGAPRAHLPARPHWGPAGNAMRRRSPAAKQRMLSLARAAFQRTLGKKSTP